MKKILSFTVLLFVFTFSFSQIITTVAGNGTRGYSGNGGPATAAELSYPFMVSPDTGNGFFMTDQGNNVI